MIELFRRAELNGPRLAIVSAGGEFTYSELMAAARLIAAELLAGRKSLEGARVGSMIDPGFAYVAAQWGTWLAGGIAVPLALTNPAAELEYVIEDADMSAIIAGGDFVERLGRIAGSRDIPLHDVARLLALQPSTIEPAEPATDDAMLLYTSGTTGRAKGVVWRHSAIEAQAKMMTEAWGWQPDDRVLLVLPLHHVHGLINVVTTALWNGATVEMLPRFDVDATWSRLGGGETTVFMAVPTIYRRLLTAWDGLDPGTRATTSSHMADMRLMVSGSAALPVATLEAWREVSGHTLLERYGMTEIGMALSNSYEADRIPGAVGRPLPSVEARVVDELGSVVGDGEAGDLQVQGPSVFEHYWRKPAETQESFTDGWFQTGDVVAVHDGIYRILGRRSVDIIKTGGEKVSALEIEEVLRRHPSHRRLRRCWRRGR